MKKHWCHSLTRILCVVAVIGLLCLPVSRIAFAETKTVTVHAGQTVTVNGNGQKEIDRVVNGNRAVAQYTGYSSSFIGIGGSGRLVYSLSIMGIGAGNANVMVYASDASVIDTVAVTVTDHDWKPGAITQNATCSLEGVQQYSCSLCDAVKTVALPKVSHTDGTWVIAKEPTCTEAGSKEQQCSVCQETMSTESIPATGHTEGSWVTVKEPTCTEAGCKELRCSVCQAALETEAIPSTGHTEGSWVTVKEPTCTEEGSREQQCSVCQATLDTEAIPSTGHTEGSWVTVKEPTCTEEGSKEQQCSVCQHVLGMEVISATGHKDGEWKTAKAANCKEDGLEELFCANCGEVVDQKILPAAGVEHKPGELVTTVQATCITDGKMAQSCTVCGIELKTETIPATGHTEGKWVVVKKATRTEEGLKQISCIVCGAVLEEEVIPVVVTDMWYNKTICTLGIRFRDIKPEIITDDAQWYMFTPVDLSTDGVTELQLVAGNVHFVGKAKVTVQDGVLIVSAKPLSGLEVLDLTFTVLPDVASAETVDISTMKQYAFDTEISIQDDLDGDTNVLLYVYGHAHYDAMDEQIARFWHTSNSYEKQVEDWKNMMD